MAKRMSPKALKKAIDSMGGIDKFNEGFERHRKDAEYFDTHRQELLRDYKEEWVAVYNGVVVGHSKDFLKLIGKLSEEEKDSVIQRVTTKKMRWILSRSLAGASSLS